MKRNILIALGLFALLSLACGSTSQLDTSATSTPVAEPVEATLPAATDTPVAEPVEATLPAATDTPIPATATPEPVATRCQPADPALLAAIAAGLTVDGGGDLRNGWTVRSSDFEKVYFVAAEITGAGMNGTVGLWATNDPAGAGMIFAVDGLANEFSDWADGRKTDAAFSTFNDGAREAIDCAKSTR